MPDSYFNLSPADRLEVLRIAASSSGRPAHILEKDIGVVVTLDALYQSSLGKHLVFKGGTSLSKAYKVINRFSEDIDLTHDIRELIPELVQNAPDSLPPNRSQADKWRDAINARLPEWIEGQVVPALQKHFKAIGLSGKITLSFKPGAHSVSIDFGRLAPESEYIPAAIKLDFGARSTGEPAEVHQVACDIADHVAEVEFPKASPRVMLPQRTFYEKATAAHVYCRQDKPEAERFSRHWHDLARLDSTGYAKKALDDLKLADEVAAHKRFFFREVDVSGEAIDYRAAVRGAMQLVPDSKRRANLKADYEKMIEERILLDEGEPFSDLMDKCSELEKRANMRLRR